MTFAGMNDLAILIATIAGFAFGAAYYMSLSKPWVIDGIHWLGVLVIQGAIIGAMGV